MKRPIRLLAALLGSAALSACTVGPNYRAPAPLPPASSALTAAEGNRATAAGEAPAQWWRLFADPVLDRLVEEALAHNTDLRQAAANLQRARALLAEAGAARLPTTTVSGQGTRQHGPTGNFGAGAGAGSGSGVTSDYFTVGFDASYEIDLFGGVTRSIQAARADRDAAAAALDAARVSVAAEVARTYATACGNAAQANAARETARLQGETLGLTQRLLQGGRSTQRDVDQAVVLVEQARAQVATFAAEQRAALYALAVLTGQSPSTVDPDAEACIVVPTLSAPVPVGDGQALLARRPDVRQAERTLAADTARIGVATAALYPQINLLGAVGLAAGNIGDLGKSGTSTWSIGSLISWIFPFNGAARARVRENKAIAEGSLAAFDGTILAALQETQQALARLAGALDREDALSRAFAASRNAAFLTQKRFDFGADSFFELLDAQRTQANTRAALASAQYDRAVTQVSLFKALGGGWEDAPAP